MRMMQVIHATVVLVLMYSVSADAVRSAEDAHYYEGYRLARIEIEDWHEFEIVEGTGAVVLSCVPGVGPLDVVANDAQLSAIAGAGMAYSVRHNNVQQLIDRERGRPLRDNPFEDFFLDYHPYNDDTGGIVWYLSELAARYPNIVSLIAVGETIEGRTIWGVRVGSGIESAKPGVVVFGCQHAREWISSTLPSYLAHHLASNYGSDARVTELLDRVEFFLIPVVNADGYVFSWSGSRARLWRKNRRDNGNGTYGVDLNRNWAEGWGEAGSSSNPGSILYCGTEPFSEPETQAVRDFLQNHSRVRAVVDVHSYSQMILWPYGTTEEPPPDQDTYQTLGSAMQSLVYDVHGRNYNAGSLYTALYPVGGGSIDWTYTQLGVLSYGLELRPPQYDPDLVGFELPAEEIIPNSEEMLPAILHLGESDWVQLPIRIDYPAGLPSTILPEVETAIPVRVRPQSEAVLCDSVMGHWREDTDGRFASAQLPVIGENLYEFVLPFMACSAQPQYYFSAIATNGVEVVDPAGASGEFHRVVMESGRAAFYAEDLDIDPGWEREGRWMWGTPLGLGSHQGDPFVAFSGDFVYGYALNGQPDSFGSGVAMGPNTNGLIERPLVPLRELAIELKPSGDYLSNQPAKYLTTQPIDCRERWNVHIEYMRWLGVESNSPNFDEATIEASNDGVNWVVVWRASDSGVAISDEQWIEHKVDVSGVADDEPAVQIRWGMGPTDSYVTYPGWNIDDIRLTAAVCEEGLEAVVEGRGFTVQSARSRSSQRR